MRATIRGASRSATSTPHTEKEAGAFGAPKPGTRRPFHLAAAGRSGVGEAEGGEGEPARVVAAAGWRRNGGVPEHPDVREVDPGAGHRQRIGVAADRDGGDEP